MTTFLKWALIGGVAGLIVVGMNSAIGQERPKYVTQPVDGLRYTAVYDQKLWPEMTFTVWIDNVENQPRKLDLPVKLVRQDFKGNPGSRVVRPSDYVNPELESGKVTGQIAANGTRMFTVKFKYRPEPRPDKGATRITYMLRVDGSKPVSLAAARPAP
jgi:hypothetical protein